MEKLIHRFPQLIDSVRVKHRSKGYRQKSIDVVDPETGETESMVMREHLQKQTDTTEFVKLYAASIDWIFDLNKPDQRVARIILKTIMDGPLNAEYIYLNYRIAVEDYCYTKSRQEWSNSIRRLEKRGVIDRDRKRPGHIFVNPDHFYKGDRMEIIRRGLDS